LIPACTTHLESRGFGLGLLKSTFNAENFIRRLFLGRKGMETKRKIGEREEKVKLPLCKNSGYGLAYFQSCGVTPPLFAYIV